jgi:hypothetical protein
MERLFSVEFCLLQDAVTVFACRDGGKPRKLQDSLTKNVIAA